MNNNITFCKKQDQVVKSIENPLSQSREGISNSERKFENLIYKNAAQH